MRYHTQQPSIYTSIYGELYRCNHPVYSQCTLYKIGDRGLAVVQQKYDPESKRTWWGEISPWLTDPIYLNPNFKSYFDSRAGKRENGFYPTVSIRQIMWGLKMKPIPRQRWETVFDRKII